MTATTRMMTTFAFVEYIWADTALVSLVTDVTGYDRAIQYNQLFIFKAINLLGVLSAL